MSVNEILRNAEQVKYLGTATLNNTIKHPAVYSDQVCGNYAIGQITSDFKYESNANVKISNDRIKNTETTVQMSGNVSTGVSMPEPYTSGLAKRSFGNIVLNNLDNRHDFKNRKFRGSKISIFVGGLVNKGAPTQDNMTGANFEPYIVGRFGKGNTNTQNIDLAIDADSGELEPVFPTGVYRTGDSQGRTKPYGFGRFNSLPNNMGGGLWHYHDGIVDLSGTPESSPTFAYVGNGYNLHFGTIDFYQSVTSPSFTFETKDKEDFDWTDIDSGVESSSSYGVQATVSSPLVQVLSNNDNTFTLSKPVSSNSVYNSLDFDWSVDPEFNTSASSVGDVVASVSVDGDLTVTDAEKRWFKVACDGSGDINISIDGLIANARVVVWALRSPQQTIDKDLIEPIPDSVIPPFGATVAEKHVLTFNDVNSSEITIPYVSTDDTKKIAVWFEYLEVYEQTPVELSINFDESKYSIALDSNLVSGNISINDFNNPRDAALQSSSGAEYGFVGNIKNLKAYMTIGHGSTVISLKQVVKRTDSLYDYGGYTTDNNITLAPPPVGGGSLSVNDFYLYDVVSGDDNKATAYVTARIVNTELQEVDVVMGYGGTAMVSLSSDFKTFSFETIGVTGTFYLRAFRGTLTQYLSNGGIGGNVTRTNPDEDFTVEFYVNIKPNKNSPEIQVRDIGGDVDGKISGFHISGLNSLPENIPPSVFFYDYSGYFRLSDQYRALEGSFIGSDAGIDSISAFRTISKLATGKDYISSTVTGARIGKVLEVQKPWFQHVTDMSAVCDYVAYENLATDGVTIIQRYNYGDALTHPAIKDGFIDNGIASVKQATRQFRYLVKYRKDATSDAKTKSLRSNIGYVGDVEEKEIQSIFYNKVDNEYLSGTIARDSMYAEIFEVPLVGIGHDIEIGTAREFIHKDIPSRVPCEIISKKHNEAGNTDLTLKVYRP